MMRSFYAAVMTAMAIPVTGVVASDLAIEQERMLERRVEKFTVVSANILEFAAALTRASQVPIGVILPESLGPVAAPVIGEPEVGRKITLELRDVTVQHILERMDAAFAEKRPGWRWDHNNMIKVSTPIADEQYEWAFPDGKTLILAPRGFWGEKNHLLLTAIGDFEASGFEEQIVAGLCQKYFPKHVRCEPTNFKKQDPLPSVDDKAAISRFMEQNFSEHVTLSIKRGIALDVLNAIVQANQHLMWSYQNGRIKFSDIRLPEHPIFHQPPVEKEITLDQMVEEHKKWERTRQPGK